jgi:hypothetical protein
MIYNIVRLCCMNTLLVVSVWYAVGVDCFTHQNHCESVHLPGNIDADYTSDEVHVSLLQEKVMLTGQHGSLKVAGMQQSLQDRTKKEGCDDFQSPKDVPTSADDVKKVEKTAAKAESVKSDARPVVDVGTVDVGALILEPRCHVALPLVVWNMRTKLPKLPIQIVHASANELCVSAWFSNMSGVTLTKLEDSYWPGYHDHRDMSWIYTTAAFWSIIQHEKVLSFEQDSWICNGADEKLQLFLQDDFVGAPWSPAGQVTGCHGVGNGGFSLRTVKVMQDICSQFGPTTENEDVYYCRHLEGWRSLKVPDATAAGEFAAEEYDGSAVHAPVGVHQPYLKPWYDADDALKRNCPGVDLLADANRVASLHQDAQDAIETGKQLLLQAEARMLQQDAVSGPLLHVSLASGTHKGEFADLFAVTLQHSEKVQEIELRDEATGVHR